MGALVDLILAAVFLGSPGLGFFERVLGGVMVVAAVRTWCGFWRARDRHQAWRERYRR